LCLILISLAYWGFLQEVAYAYLFFAAYALYRSGTFRRDGWAAIAAPTAVFAMASAVALLFSSPRLLTVGSDFFQLVRSDRFNYLNFGQLARFFHEGIYGRYFEEGLLLQNPLNLNEGLQLVSSVTLSLVVCYGILRLTTGSQRPVAWVFGAMILALWGPNLFHFIFAAPAPMGISQTTLLICSYTVLLGMGAYFFARPQRKSNIEAAG